MNNFIKTGLRQRALTARRHWKELPFSVLVDGDLHEGVIDLVIEEDDGLVLVDYKTDRLASEQEARKRLDAAYRGQGEFYRRALEEAGLEVKEVLFAFLGPGCALRLRSERTEGLQYPLFRGLGSEEEPKVGTDY